MARPKRSAQAKKNPDSKQVVITLSVPGREVIKVETLDASGKRHKLADEDFAALAGDSDVEGLFPVLEEAYVAGFSDANGDESGDDEYESDDDDLEQVVIRGAASRTLIRRGVRRLILGRLAKRQALKKQGHRATASETSH
jgi:hypothetical protein